VVCGAAAGALALAFVAYALWPSWPKAPPAGDPPHLPIDIAGETFQVPPAAIRVNAQRRPGPQERVDLIYLWPSLVPPPPPGKGVSAGAVLSPDRLFVSIAGHEGKAEPVERLRATYLRYVQSERLPGPEGLVLVAFRDEAPYQGEDLAYAENAPERFIVRCTRSSSALAPATCIYERHVGKAGVTVRFPREWLADWRALEDGLDRLIAGLHPKPVN
jgi:hypothetical protein